MQRGSAVPDQLQPHVGNTFQYDLTEISGLDYLSSPEGPILEAQRLAADAWGADQSWFLVNGSTVGIHAAVMATCLMSRDSSSRSTLIMARNSHLSGYNAVALAGCNVRYVYPHIACGLAHHVTADSIEKAIGDTLNEGLIPKAVLIVSPTYFGIMSDIERIVGVCHQHDIPVMVDEAHGAHVKFIKMKEKRKRLLSALDAGADVVVQSTHKQLAALTQGAMLHLKGSRVSPACISQALLMLHTSSPSYILMASLDAARAQAQHGKVMDDAHAAACHIQEWFHEQDSRDKARKESKLPYIELLTPSLLAKRNDTTIDAEQNDEFDQNRFPDKNTKDYVQRDPWRFTVLLRNMPGTVGWDALYLLEHRHGVVAELATHKSIVFAVGIGTTMKHARALTDALDWFVDRDGWKVIQNHTMVPHHKGAMNEEGLDNEWLSWDIENKGMVHYTPSEALRRSGAHCAVPLCDAVGRVSAELLCPYPPGVPVLCPGEVFSEELVRLLQAVVDAGGKVVGAHDGSLKTVRVLR